MTHLAFAEARKKLAARRSSPAMAIHCQERQRRCGRFSSFPSGVRSRGPSAALHRLDVDGLRQRRCALHLAPGPHAANSKWVTALPSHRRLPAALLRVTGLGSPSLAYLSWRNKKGKCAAGRISRQTTPLTKTRVHYPTTPTGKTTPPTPTRAGRNKLRRRAHTPANEHSSTKPANPKQQSATTSSPSPGTKKQPLFRTTSRPLPQWTPWTP